MLRTESFAKLGLFVDRSFFNPATCREVREEFALSLGTLGTIYMEGKGGEGPDPNIRNVRRHAVSPSTASRIGSQFEEMQPVLSRHFDLALKGFEDLQFLRYKPGDFYLPHLDAAEDPDAPGYMRNRKVSVVLFLNSAGEQPDPNTYGGGSLTFYGLLPDPRWRPVGFGLEGVEGMLVAFRSGILHEVTPVTHGQRYTLVTWYY